MNISNDLLSTYLLEEDLEDFISNGIPSVVILSIIAIIGTVGNLITCLVSFFRKDPSTHQTLVMFLAAVDLCSCTISIPLAALWVRYPYTFTSSEVCKISRFLSIYFSFGSYAVLDIIALERYGKVVWAPEKQLTPKQAKAICISVCVIAGVLVAFPAFFVYGISKRLTPKRHLSGFECSVLAENRETIFLSLYLYFGILLVLFLFGCCFVLYGLIGRRFVILSRASHLQTSASVQKSINREVNIPLAVVSDFSVSFNESEKCNYCRNVNSSQEDANHLNPKIVITDEDNEQTILPNIGVNNNTQNVENTRSSLKEHCMSCPQRSSRQGHATPTEGVMESTLSTSLTEEGSGCLLSRPTINHSRKGSSEITDSSLSKDSSVNGSDMPTCDSLENRKKTVTFKTELQTIDRQSARNLDTDFLVGERTRKGTTENLFTKPKLGKKLLRGKKITLMFFILSLISILCYLPYFVILVIRNTDWDMYESMKDVLGPWEGVMWSFVYINNAINPILYGFMDSVFRQDCQMFIEQVKYYVF